MLENIAVMIAAIMVAFVVIIILFFMLANLALDRKECKVNKRAFVCLGTVLEEEGQTEYRQMIGRKARLVSPESAYKYYEKYRVRFFINGKEYIESVVLKEKKQIGETVQIKCAWNQTEGTIHPIDIGRVERYHKFLWGLLFVAGMGIALLVIHIMQLA